MATTAQPRLLKGLNDVLFEAAFWAGKNESGIKSFGKNVVIAVDRAAEVSGGGIVTGTEEALERRTASSTSGCIVYAGPEAFSRFDDGTPWVGDRPKAGDRVFFERHAGQLQEGVDGEQYRIMDYRCVSGCLDTENFEVREALVELNAAMRIEADKRLAAKLIESGVILAQPAPTDEPRALSAAEIVAAARSVGKPDEPRAPNRAERRRAARQAANA